MAAVLETQSSVRQSVCLSVQFRMAKLNELDSATTDFPEADDSVVHWKMESCRIRTQSRTELRKS